MSPTLPRHLRRQAIALAVPFALIIGAASLARAETPAPAASAIRAVSVVHPRSEAWPEPIDAAGNIMPWQEVVIGTEVGGLRLLSVQANVGDVVSKGQVLARLNPATAEIDLDAANAQLIEAEAALAQAEATLARANRLAPSGGVSQQELALYQTQKHTSEARVNAARAQVRTQQLKLDSATLLAPDDGLISSRSAAEGAIVPAGSELFRLIRQGRLEWRAEVKGETLLRLAPGQEATVVSPLGPQIRGRVRQVSPTIDLKTRNGLVYVDLPADANLKAGLKVSGTLTTPGRRILTLPAGALLCREAACRVFVVRADGRLAATDVRRGRVSDERVEIVAGVDEHSRVVAGDLADLRAGDRVEVAAEEDANGANATPAR